MSTNIRATFLADEGELMVRCDLSQVEDRVCKMYCGTDRMVELANKKPWEYDAHTDTASRIFNKPHSQISKDERYLSKKVRHGSQRGLRGATMSDSISKDTEGKVFVHPAQCDRLIDKYLDEDWEVRDIYFPWVRQQVMEVGMLYNSWGRRFDVRNRRIDEDLYRECYSWYMQSEDADWTNQYLFLPMSYYMQSVYKKPCSAQVHDEVIVSAPPKDVLMVSQVMVKLAERTREISAGSGNYLTVPSEITVGRSYGDEMAVEFERLPEEGEFWERLREHKLI